MKLRKLSALVLSAALLLGMSIAPASAAEIGVTVDGKTTTIDPQGRGSYLWPALSPDGTWLYFTSDMPGGYGGLDIWRAALSGGKVRFTENLGPDINTPGDECFPAFRPTGELYFSSDGRGGMGGLDL